MISAGWTTNGSGDRYSLIDECNHLNITNKKIDIFGLQIGAFKYCLVRDLLSSPSYDMLIRRILEDGAKYGDKCKVSRKCGVKCIFVGKNEYRATSSEIYRRSCFFWR